MQSESLISTTSRNVSGFSGPERILKWMDAKWKGGLRNPPFKLFVEVMDVMSSGPKRKRTIQIVISTKFKSQHLWGCVSAHGMGNSHICEGTINAERYIQVLEQHMLPSKQRLFQGRPCLFQQDNAQPHYTYYSSVA